MAFTAGVRDLQSDDSSMNDLSVCCQAGRVAFLLLHAARSVRASCWSRPCHHFSSLAASGLPALSILPASSGSLLSHLSPPSISLSRER